jgi:hypothetical protein
MVIRKNLGGTHDRPHGVPAIPHGAHERAIVIHNDSRSMTILESLDAVRGHVSAVLMKHDTRGATVCVDDERELRVEVFDKEVAGALGEDLEPRLTGRLRVKPVAVPRDRKDEVRRELVAADVSVKDLRIDGSLLVAAALYT